MATRPNPVITIYPPAKRRPLRQEDEWQDWSPQQSEWEDFKTGPVDLGDPAKHEQPTASEREALSFRGVPVIIPGRPVPRQRLPLTAPLISPEFIDKAMSYIPLGGHPQGGLARGATIDEIARARDAAIAKGDEPWRAGALEFARGARQTMANLGSNITSPAGLSMLLPFKPVQAIGGALFGLEAAKNIGYEPRWLESEQRFENPAEVTERMLLGGAGVAGGAAAVGKSLAPKTGSIPVETAARFPLEVAKRGAIEIAKNLPEITGVPQMGRAVRGRIQRSQGIDPESQAMIRMVEPELNAVRSRLQQHRDAAEAQASSAYDAVDAAIQRRNVSITGQDPVQISTGSILLPEKALASIKQHMTAKEFGDITGGNQALTFRQVQRLNSALSRAYNRTANAAQPAVPVLNEIQSLRQGLSATLKAEATRAGVLPEFEAANKGWAKFAKDWLESPLAESLDAEGAAAFIKPFLEKNKGAQAVRTAREYGVDLGEMEALVAAGADKVRFMLENAPRQELLGPRQFARTMLQERGEAASQFQPWEGPAIMASGASFPITGGIGPSAAAALLARHAPAVLRSSLAQRALTGNLPEYFPTARQQTSAPVSAEFVFEGPGGAMPSPPRVPPSLQLPERGTPMSATAGPQTSAGPAPVGARPIIPTAEEAAAVRSTLSARPALPSAPSWSSAWPDELRSPAPLSDRFSSLTPSRYELSQQGTTPLVPFQDRLGSIGPIPLGGGGIRMRGATAEQKALPPPSGLTPEPLNIPALPPVLPKGVVEMRTGPHRRFPLEQPKSEAKAAAASTSEAELLDSIADRTTAQPFASLDATGKAAVRLLLARRQKAGMEPKPSPQGVKFETKDGKVGMVDEKGKFTVKPKTDVRVEAKPVRPALTKPEAKSSLQKGDKVSYTDSLGKRGKGEVVRVFDQKGKTVVEIYDEGSRFVPINQVVKK